jgi:hypothetical protein
MRKRDSLAPCRKKITHMQYILPSAQEERDRERKGIGKQERERERPKFLLASASSLCAHDKSPSAHLHETHGFPHDALLCNDSGSGCEPPCVDSGCASLSATRTQDED